MFVNKAVVVFPEQCVTRRTAFRFLDDCRSQNGPTCDELSRFGCLSSLYVAVVFPFNRSVCVFITATPYNNVAENRTGAPSKTA